jgi:hypothetical protein
MNNSMANMMAVFIMTILVSLFYWQIVRPVFMHAIRYRLFARRDQLRELAIDGYENAQSFSYTYLEAFINKTISFMPSIGLVAFIIYSVQQDKRGTTPEFRRFEEEASLSLKEIRNKSVQDALLFMIVNSPVMVMAGALVAAILWVCGKVNKIILLNNTESFVEDLRVTPA